MFRVDNPVLLSLAQSGARLVANLVGSDLTVRFVVSAISRLGHNVGDLVLNCPKPVGGSVRAPSICVSRRELCTGT
jgi:hypothetical protein